ncbi:MAG: AAA family ATPase [Termitinemataceae bacterium]|nr:MAG: AAA family ATPase [Termitinemataceae bacterium]
MKNAPLADRMRPRTLDEVIGQEHIVGHGRLLRRSIAADRLSSVIFYGPPGTGKTSLGRVIANTTAAAFESLNAVLGGIKDIREAIDRSKERLSLYGQKTILFVDEVHRWNKSQQDALLPWVENGTVVLVGATTENPFFEVNRALVSRSRIFSLHPLSNDNLREAARCALCDIERGYGKWKVEFAPGALDHLVEVSSGDARCLLNALELAVETTSEKWPPQDGEHITITMQAAEESIQKRAVLYDKDGDYHFDTISAFIKSVRGSDPDAALYWLAKMVRAGEDPAFIFRRMIILASEDIGLADPYALQVVISCAESFERIGFPEGNFPLSHACLYLATAPKSNTTLSFFDALKEVDRADGDVPNHLKDASRDGDEFGHGVGYNYPHSYREHWIAQQYLPSALQGKMFYTPGHIGYEKTIYNEVMRRRELTAALILESKKKEGISSSWAQRTEETHGEVLEAGKNSILELAQIQRSSRVLLLNADDGLLLWEVSRLVTEGIVASLVTSNLAKENLLSLSKTLQIDGELLKVECGHLGEIKELFDCAVFDCIITQELNKDFSKFAHDAKQILAEDGKIIFIATPPTGGTNLCSIVADEEFTASCELFKAEHAQDLWGEKEIKKAFDDAGLNTQITAIKQKEDRLLSDININTWFNEKSAWGTFICKTLGNDHFEKIKQSLFARSKKGPISFVLEKLLVKGTHR